MSPAKWKARLARRSLGILLVMIIALVLVAAAVEINYRIVGARYADGCPFDGARQLQPSEAETAVVRILEVASLERDGVGLQAAVILPD
ncbi:MAG: hypothetical protein WBA88_06070, partial [Pseudaminobacter sp.]